MARKVHVAAADLDGDSGATQTVPFALDGISYEIELTKENARILRGLLAPYIEHGRRVGGRRLRAVSPRQVADGEV